GSPTSMSHAFAAENESPAIQRAYAITNAALSRAAARPSQSPWNNTPATRIKPPGVPSRDEGRIATTPTSRNCPIVVAILSWALYSVEARHGGHDVRTAI